MILASKNSSKRFIIFILTYFSLLLNQLPRITQAAEPTELDVLLVGGGVMSATLGAMLKELDPKLKMEMYERLDRIAGESSGPLNNAGTGHAALAELNYTPANPDGTIDIKKAVQVAEWFEVSKQFWGYLAAKGYLGDPKAFINSVPHLSLVRGEDSIEYLQKRFEALQTSPLFQGMQFSRDPAVLKVWIPPVMSGNNLDEKIAATRSELGTDVNFGKLTESLVKHISQKGTGVYLQHEIQSLNQNPDGTWTVEIKNLKDKSLKTVRTKFIFLGAGGAAISLLQKSGIPEARGFGGFPISGQFLVCQNPELAESLNGKIYGKARVGSPPMSVPHLDTRVIDGKRSLVFGPFAGFSTRLLKYGSLTDLFRTLNTGNLGPMLSAGVHNIPLTRYLIEQLLLSHEQRMNELRIFVPDAKSDEWKLEVAGQRVQIIKKGPDGKGVLQFGTEVVSSKDHSLSALLGASPGASTSVSIMIEVLERNFGERMRSGWQNKLQDMIPSYGLSLAQDAELTDRVRSSSHQALKLDLDWKTPCGPKFSQIR